MAVMTPLKVLQALFALATIGVAVIGWGKPWVAGVQSAVVSGFMFAWAMGDLQGRARVIGLLIGAFLAIQSVLLLVF